MTSAPEKAAPILAEVLAKLVDLVEELCEAVDCESDDIGGKRGSLTILREIGPLVKPARAIMQDRVERIREDERDRLYEKAVRRMSEPDFLDDNEAAFVQRFLSRLGAMHPNDHARLRGDAS